MEPTQEGAGTEPLGPLEERPARIAKRRAEVAAAPTVRIAPAAGEAARSPDPEHLSEGLASVLGRHLGARRRLEEVVEELSGRVAALTSTRSAGRPRSAWPASLATSLASAVAVGLVVYLALAMRLASLDADLATVLDRTDGLAAELAASREAAGREGETARADGSRRVAELQASFAAERKELEAARIELEKRGARLEEGLASAGAARATLEGRIEVLERELEVARRLVALGREAREAPPEPPEPRESAVQPPERVEPPPPETDDRTVADKLNLLLARADGARIHRVLDSAGVVDGALSRPFLKILSAEGEVVEEIRAERVSVELSGSTRRAVLSFHDCSRKQHRGGREETTRLPWFQVELFDVDVEAWGAEIPEIVRWTR